MDFQEPKSMKAHTRRNRLLGWIAVSLTISMSSIWAFWGIIENFHEGWFSTSILENLFMMFIQYMSLSIIFVAIGLIALHWRKIGLTIFSIIAIWLAIFFSFGHFAVVGIMIVIPFIGLGLLFFFGNLLRTSQPIWHVHRED